MSVRPRAAGDDAVPLHGAGVGMSVRPLAPGDDAGVQAVFRATVALGHPLGLSGPGIDRYESLCLDWYLGP
ncbi:MAG TPA: hypothetical protein VGI06_14300, partial [Acidimicrobiales bacterium]